MGLDFSGSDRLSSLFRIIRLLYVGVIMIFSAPIVAEVSRHLGQLCFYIECKCFL